MNKKTLVSLIAFALSAGSFTAHAASTLVANDDQNTLQGLDTSMEYKLSTEQVWKRFVSYDDLPALTGNVVVTVRQATTDTPPDDMAQYPAFNGTAILYEEGRSYSTGMYVDYRNSIYLVLAPTSSIPGSDSTWYKYTGQGMTPVVDVDTSDEEGTYTRFYPFSNSWIVYEPGMKASPGNWVEYNGHYYMAIESTTSIPGSDASWRTQEETEAAHGLDIPGAAQPDETELKEGELGRFVFTPWAAEKAAAYQNEQKAAVAAQRKLIGTFSERGVDEAIREGKPYLTPEAVISGWGDKLTHLNYEDAIINNHKIIGDDFANGPDLMRRLHATSVMKNIKQLITINGNGEQLFYEVNPRHNAETFENALTTPESVDALADSMVAYMLKHSFDGINIKWTQTDTETDRLNFTRLIQDLRTKLDAEGKQQDKYFQLTATVTGDYRNIQYVNSTETAPLLDAITVAAYDMHKPSQDNVTGHRAGLFASSQDSDKNLNVDAVMKAYQNTYHVPKNKLVMGVDFSGYGWSSVEPTEVVKGLPGLLTSGSATLTGPWDDTYMGTKNGYTSYADVVSLLNGGKYNRYYDREARVPYVYSASTKNFYTYEDDQSLRAKINYIQSEGLAGISVANLSGDTYEKALATVVKSVRYLPAPSVKTDELKGLYVTNFDNEKRITLNLDPSALTHGHAYRVEVDGKYVFSTEGTTNYYSYRYNYGNEVSLRTGQLSSLLKPGATVTVTRTTPNKAVIGKVVVTQEMVDGNNPVLNDGSVKSLTVFKKGNVPYIGVDFDKEKLNSAEGSSWVAKVINDDKKKGNYIFNCDNGKCFYSTVANKENNVTRVESDERDISVGETIVVERVSPNPATVAKIVVTADMLK